MLKFTFLIIFFSSTLLAHDRIYEGQYTYGNEVSVFQECGKEKVYWLDASGFIFSEVEQLALKGIKPYTPIYVKFRGHEHIEEVDGYAADYEYQIYVSEVKEFNSLIPAHCENTHNKSLKHDK